MRPRASTGKVSPDRFEPATGNDPVTLGFSTTEVPGCSAHAQCGYASRPKEPHGYARGPAVLPATGALCSLRRVGVQVVETVGGRVSGTDPCAGRHCDVDRARVGWGRGVDGVVVDHMERPRSDTTEVNCTGSVAPVVEAEPGDRHRLPSVREAEVRGD